MVRISAFLVMGAVMCLPAYVQAQSPIPESRVPGFGGTKNPGGGPASTGSDIGSNVGAGATASPINNDPDPPGMAPSIAEAPPPLLGASRNLPLTGPEPTKPPPGKPATGKPATK